MFARTPRLLLRPGFTEDAPMLAAVLGDAAIARNLSRLPHPYGEDEARAWLSRDEQPGEHSLLIFMRTAAQLRLVGGIGLHPVASGEDGSHDWGNGAAMELGYWIARPYWGLGIATEAGQALLASARAAGRTPVVAGHFVDNPASGRVLRKLGLRPTGRVVPRLSVGRGGPVPCALFALPEEDAVDGDMPGNGDVPSMADQVYRDSESRPNRVMASRLAA